LTSLTLRQFEQSNIVFGLMTPVVAFAVQGKPIFHGKKLTFFDAEKYRSRNR
jgi:hypothetical protein